MGFAGFGWIRLHYRRKRAGFVGAPFLSGRMKDTPAGTVITFRYRLPYWMTFFNLIAIPIAARLAYEIHGNIYANGGVSGITIGLAWIVVIPVTEQLFRLRRADKDLEALLGWCSRIIQADPPPLDME